MNHIHVVGGLGHGCRKAGGFGTAHVKLSEPLSALLGVDSLPRPQVVKRIWEYIKANNLQVSQAPAGCRLHAWRWPADAVAVCAHVPPPRGRSVRQGD